MRKCDEESTGAECEDDDDKKKNKDERKGGTNTREEKFEVGVECGGFRVECTKQKRAREGEEPQVRSLSTSKLHGVGKE